MTKSKNRKARSRARKSHTIVHEDSQIPTRITRSSSKKLRETTLKEVQQPVANEVGKETPSEETPKLEPYMPKKPLAYVSHNIRAWVKSLF